MKNKTTDALAILKRHVDADPELKAMVQEARAHRQMSEPIADLSESQNPPPSGDQD